MCMGILYREDEEIRLGQCPSPMDVEGTTRHPVFELQRKLMTTFLQKLGMIVYLDVTKNHLYLLALLSSKPLHYCLASLVRRRT